MSASKHEGRQNENIANSSSIAFLKEARTASQDELKVYKHKKRRDTVSRVFEFNHS